MAKFIGRMKYHVAFVSVVVSYLILYLLRMNIMANPNPKGAIAWDMAVNYAEQHNLESPRDSFQDPRFIHIYNTYVKYIQSGVLPRGERKRDIEAVLGRRFH